MLRKKGYIEDFPHQALQCRRTDVCSKIVAPKAALTPDAEIQFFVGIYRWTVYLEDISLGCLITFPHTFLVQQWSTFCMKPTFYVILLLHLGRNPPKPLLKNYVGIILFHKNYHVFKCCINRAYLVSFPVDHLLK